MKYRAVPVVLILIQVLSGCNNSKSTVPVEVVMEESGPALRDSNQEIMIRVKDEDPTIKDVFPDGYIPWISLDHTEEQLPNLEGKDDIVLTDTAVTVKIDYPVNEPFEISLSSDKASGFTRGELILKICLFYRKMYEEEEATATEKTLPMDQRGGLINRNETNGKYGICCHDISDLDISSIIVIREPGKKTKLELFIES